MGSFWKAVSGFFKGKQTMEDKPSSVLPQDEVNDDNDSSDSDDEDFIPNEANEGAVSEEDSEGEAEDNDGGESSKKKTDKKGSKNRKRKAPKNSVVSSLKSKRGKFGESEEETDKDTDLNGSQLSKGEDEDDSEKEEDGAINEAHEKEETDKLWASFLTSVDEETKKRKNKERTIEKVINKVYDFAGEKVSVEERVKVTVDTSLTSDNESSFNNVNNSIDSNLDSTSTLSSPSGSGSTSNNAPLIDLETDQPIPGPSSAITNGNKMKPPDKPKKRRGGISILGNDPENIGLDDLEKRGLTGLLKAFQTKSQKIGTLEKSKLDWERYKRQHELEEELETHNRSRNTFIEKQEFLQRADHRQFEIEKNMRTTQRSKRLAN